MTGPSVQHGSISIEQALALVARGEVLNANQTEAIFTRIMSGDVPDIQISGLLMALKTRGEQAEELLGVARTLRAYCPKVEVPEGSVDTCGTGGDGLSTRNVSTAAAVVAAACGVPVAKHGNRSATSRSSSSAVLEALGVAVDLPHAAVSTCIARLGIGFMLANRYHAATGAVAGVRKTLGVPTLFNLVGPLSNPAQVRRQMLGVFEARWLEPMAQALGALGAVHAWVVHGAGGMDELSLAGPSRVAQWKDGEVSAFEIVPEDAGLARAPIEAITGGDAADNATAIRALLDGAPGAYRDTVLLNTAATLVVADHASSLRDGAEQAQQAIDSGAARARLDQWVSLSQSLSKSES